MTKAGKHKYTNFKSQKFHKNCCFFRINSFVSILTPQCVICLCYVICAHIVLAAADNRCVVRDDGHVEVAERLLRWSAAILITDRQQLILLDGAVDCDPAGCCRQVGAILRHHKHHGPGNHFCKIHNINILFVVI